MTTYVTRNRELSAQYPAREHLTVDRLDAGSNPGQNMEASALKGELGSIRGPRKHQGVMEASGDNGSIRG